MPRKRKSAPVPVCSDETLVGGALDETQINALRFGTVTLSYADLEKLIPLPAGMQIVALHQSGPLTVQLVVHSPDLPISNGNAPEIDLDIQDIVDERAGVMARYAEITAVGGVQFARKVG